MKIIFAFLIAATLVTPAVGQDKAQLIGHYSNIVTSNDDEPHILSGYGLSVFIKNNHPYGKIEVATGSEEAMGARLKDVVFNPITKKLTFRAEFPDGWEPSAIPDPRPVVVFSGRVEPRRVIGHITVSDAHCATCKSKTSRLILKRTKDDFTVEESALSYLPDPDAALQQR